MHACVGSRFSCVQLFVSLWTIAQQAPLFKEFSPGKNTGMGYHALPQGVFPTQGSLASPVLAGTFFSTSAARGAQTMYRGRQSNDGNTVFLRFQFLYI